MVGVIDGLPPSSESMATVIGEAAGRRWPVAGSELVERWGNDSPAKGKGLALGEAFWLRNCRAETKTPPYFQDTKFSHRKCQGVRGNLACKS